MPYLLKVLLVLVLIYQKNTKDFVLGLAICCIVVTTPDIHSTTVSKNDELNIDITAIDGVLKLVDKTQLHLE